MTLRQHELPTAAHGVPTAADILSWMGQPRHPNKEINAAVQYAVRRGWQLVLSQGHAWGRLFCPRRQRDGCKLSVWSTPRNPTRHAKKIRQAVNRCTHSTTP